MRKLDAPLGEPKGVEKQIISLPAIGAYPSRQLTEAVLDAADEAGIAVEVRGDAILESADGIATALHFDLTPWLPVLQGAAAVIVYEVMEGAVGEIGAEGLRRFARMARGAVDRATHKPFVDAHIKFQDGSDRLYNLPGTDIEAAAEAILRDVGLAASHPLDRARFWDEGRWIGGHEWHEREREREPFQDSGAALPRRETFAALKELQALFGTEVRYLSRQDDLGVLLPPKTKSETIEAALGIIRRHLPASAIGLDSTRKIIVVENGLVTQVRG